MQQSDRRAHTLKEVDEENDPAILIDRTPSFSKHSQTHVNKANRVLGTLNNTFKCLYNYSFFNLYKTIIIPHLEYISVIWATKH